MNKNKYTVKKISNTMILVKTKCPCCGHKIALPVQKADFENWKNGMIALDAFPNPVYTDGDREFFVTGLCEECMRKIFNFGD